MKYGVGHSLVQTILARGREGIRSNVVWGIQYV